MVCASCGHLALVALERLNRQLLPQLKLPRGRLPRYQQCLPDDTGPRRTATAVRPCHILRRSACLIHLMSNSLPVLQETADITGTSGARAVAVSRRFLHAVAVGARTMPGRAAGEHAAGKGKITGDLVAQKQGLERGEHGLRRDRLCGKRNRPERREGCGADVSQSFPEMVDAAVKRRPDIVFVAGGRTTAGLLLRTRSAGRSTGMQKGLTSARIIGPNPWDVSDYRDFLVDIGG